MARTFGRGVGRRIVLLTVSALLLALVAPGGADAQQTGELSGDLPTEGGFAIVAWSGGPAEAVGPAAAARGCAAVSLWVTREGALTGYVFGAPAFVNATFLAGLPDGSLPAGPVLLVCRGTTLPAPPPPPGPAPALDAPDLSDYMPSSTQIGQYQAAVNLRDAGQHAQAAQAFGQIAVSNSPLAPVAMMRAAQMLSTADQKEAAAQAFQEAVAAPGLPPTLRIVARLDAASVLRDLNRHGEALAMLEGVTTANRATATQIAQARWLRARILRDQGNNAWLDEARGVVAAYPGTTHARSALIALETAGAPVPSLDAALVRYLHREDALALARFESIAATGATSEAHVAWFYIGAIRERAGDRTGAIAAYRTAIERAPQGRLGADAHWWAAVLLAGNGQRGAAAQHYETLAAQFPSSTFTSDASVRAALLRVQMAQDAAAISGLNAMLSRSTGRDAARAARWLHVVGASAPAPGQYDPRSISAILHAAGEGATSPLPPAALNEWTGGATADWQAAATWMQARYGPATPIGTADAEFLRLSFGLAAAGEPVVARSILRTHIAMRADQGYALLHLSRLASAAGLHDISISAADRILSSLPSGARLETPIALERLAYPTPFAEETLAAAQAERVPPLLLAALVRRESMYHPEAVSSANARGLTQVIPSTGQDIARSLGVPWDPAMLFDPATSLRFGAHYLSLRLNGFDGDVFAALAAYNGGAGNAARWLQNQPRPGADWYIESVTFTETRTYLRVVVEDYAWYRYLYAGAPAPQMR